jgi:Tol biopolymer transport system component
MRGHELADFGLWKISVSGGKPEPLAAFGQSMYSVAVSPKGDRLAYERLPQSHHNIYEINLGGSVGRKDLPRTLISSTKEDYSPQFSPDGKKIALVSERSGSLEIWICASDGGSCSPATAFGESGSPKWSPDGRQIAFDSIKYGQ